MFILNLLGFEAAETIVFFSRMKQVENHSAFRHVASHDFQVRNCWPYGALRQDLLGSCDKACKAQYSRGLWLLNLYHLELD